MTWLDRLRPGSFRGAAFKTLSNQAEGGRRGSVLTFPLIDLPKTQDLGKAPRRFTVEAFVIGDNYDVDRDKLIAALEQGGPGKLVHRYYGEMQAEVEPGKTFSVTESQDEGGMARFQIPFIRTAEQKLVTVKIDGPTKVQLAADVAKAASVANTENKLNFDGPEFVREYAFDTINAGTEAVDAINNHVLSALYATNTVNQEIKRFSGSMANLIATPGRLNELATGMFGLNEAIMTSVGEIAYAFKKTIDSFTQNPKDSARSESRKAANALKFALSKGQYIGSDQAAISTTSSRGAQMQQNQDAILASYRESAVIEAARTSTLVAYDSNSAAVAMRDLLVDALDAQCDATTDDDVYASLRDLRVQVFAFLTTEAGELPKQRVFYPKVSLPALLVAHLVHGDARKADEIIARNNIRNPGFVPGGLPIQIVVDA